MLWGCVAYGLLWLFAADRMDLSRPSDCAKCVAGLVVSHQILVRKLASPALVSVGSGSSSCTVGRYQEVTIDMDCHASNQSLRRAEFMRLFEQYERGLCAYILSLAPDSAAADEIGQETSLLLWKEFGTFDRGTDFGAWARTIAYYQVLAYRKRLKRERISFDSELLDLLSDRTAARWNELAARQSYLIDCLAELSEFKRQVIRLYYRSGMTAKSVAERLGRSVAAVEKTLVRTRRTLYDCIEAARHREEHP